MPLSEKVRGKLVAHFKSEEAMLRAARECDIEGFREASGGSEKRTWEMISELMGLYLQDFLANEKAEAVHEQILELLGGYAHTGHARNRIRMLRPLSGADAIKERLEFCMKSKERLSALPRDAVEKLLKKIGRPKPPSPKFNGDIVLLIEDEEEFEQVSNSELPRYCRVLSSSDGSGLEEAGIIIYVSSRGRLDLTRQENVVLIPSGCRDFEMVPETILDFFTLNSELLETVSSLRSVLGQKSVCTDIVPSLEKLKMRQLDLKGYEKAVMTVRDEMNAELRKHASELQLSGDEVLEVLGQGVPRKVRDIYTKVLNTGRTRLKQLTGYDHSPFLMKFPVEIDDEELERAKRRIVAESGTALFEEKVKAARKLRELRPEVEREVAEALSFDFEFALGAFTLDYGLQMPKLGRSFNIESCAHIMMARVKDFQKVDYSFGGEDNAILLTGANSGGKTTLLETLAQIVIMARCGLPVCASKATIQLPDQLYFFAQQKNLNAGAFESFLRTLVPAVTGASRKLILADELEAMTELDAGARIVAALLERARTTNSCIIVVTHMAREISKFTKARTDGIEAQGLDADYNLVVDRTPKQNYTARSTPELILRRLAETADGDEKKVYKELLDKVKG